MEAIYFTTKLDEVRSYYESDTKSDDDIVYAVYSLVNDAHTVSKMLLLESRFEELRRCLSVCWVALGEEHVKEDGRIVLGNLTGEDRRMIDLLLQRTLLLEQQTEEVIQKNKAQNIMSYTAEVIRSQLATLTKESGLKSGIGTANGDNKERGQGESKPPVTPPKRGSAFGRSKLMRRWGGERATPPLVTYTRFSNASSGLPYETVSSLTESDEGAQPEGSSSFSHYTLRDVSATAIHRVGNGSYSSSVSGGADVRLGAAVCVPSENFVPPVDSSELFGPNASTLGRDQRGICSGLAEASAGPSRSPSEKSSSFSSYTSALSDVWAVDTGKRIARTATAMRVAVEEQYFPAGVVEGLDNAILSEVKQDSVKGPPEIPPRLSHTLTCGALVGQQDHTKRKSDAATDDGLVAFDESVSGDAPADPLRETMETADQHVETVPCLPPMQNDVSPGSSQGSVELCSGQRNDTQSTSGFLPMLTLCPKLSSEAKAHVAKVCKEYKEKMMDVNLSMEAMRRKTEEQKQLLNPKDKFVLKATNEWMRMQKTPTTSPGAAVEPSVAGQSDLPTPSKGPAEVAYKQACLSIGQRLQTSHTWRKRSSRMPSCRTVESFATDESFFSQTNTFEYPTTSSTSHTGVGPLNGIRGSAGKAATDETRENISQTDGAKARSSPTPRRKIAGVRLTDAQHQLKRLRLLSDEPFPEVHRMVIERAEKIVDLEQGGLSIGRLRSHPRSSHREGLPSNTENFPGLSLSSVQTNSLTRYGHVLSSLPSGNMHPGTGSSEHLPLLSWMKQNCGSLSAAVRKDVLGIRPSSGANLVTVVRSTDAKVTAEDLQPTILSSIDDLHRRPNWTVLNTATLSMFAPLHLAVVRIQLVLRQFIAKRELNDRKRAVEDHLARLVVRDECAIAIQRWGRWLISLQFVAVLLYRSKTYEKLSERSLNCEAPSFTDVSYELIRRFSVTGNLTTAFFTPTPEPRIRSGNLSRTGNRRVTVGCLPYFPRSTVGQTPFGLPSSSCTTMCQASVSLSRESSPVRRQREIDASRVIVKAFRKCKQSKLRVWEREMDNFLRFVTRKASAGETFKDSRCKSQRQTQKYTGDVKCSPRRGGRAEDATLFPVSPDRLLGDTYAAWEARVRKAREEGNFLTPLNSVKLSQLYSIYEQRLEVEALRRLRELEALIEAEEEQVKREELEQSLQVLQPCLRGYLARRRIAFRWKELKKGKLFSNRPARLINVSRNRTAGFRGRAERGRTVPLEGESLEFACEEEHPIPPKVDNFIQQSINRRNTLMIPITDEGRTARLRLVIMMQTCLRQKASLLCVADQYVTVCAVAIQRWWRLMTLLRKRSSDKIQGANCAI
ncbi:hypothetical protein, conserved [Trypanosoma brucei gambiense DAL972]|uniref:Uncharacterized protein n=1 Tax=Trypanosoma brucei gambiense (strain MHOM/CI/86/DAL972) TaxID=679716 RepID=C9ZXS7_TRYB9|nr:hypothetical protein, conserved [Trypanosoma brucei gambiense DAL972]CBH14222.1 hypothetical protein, conserved [Trypanosoma brucei gambiense DAL972]|eukprot:XP_011776492.1 hypothetical protein, conserved [Trypanosoma brucei gambiense DAL972]